MTKANVVYAQPGCEPAPPDHPPGMGIVFADLDPAVEDRLRHFLGDLRDRFKV